MLDSHHSLAPVEAPASSFDAIASAFAACSAKAARDVPSLPIRPPSHILREDIVKCLETAAKRPLSMRERSAIQRSFSIDIAPLISWDEFQTSFAKFQARMIEDTSPKTEEKTPYVSGIRSRTRLLEARRRGMSTQKRDRTPVVPLTSSQEIGWYVLDAAAVKAAGTHNCNTAALNGTDVTKGEGRSLQSYYGAHLGRSF